MVKLKNVDLLLWSRNYIKVNFFPPKNSVIIVYFGIKNSILKEIEF